ncbi:hypothetical protein [Nostoc sp. FACHB-133]|nr:hypothetical protein [Nostoc sp. FACHB-133]
MSRQLLQVGEPQGRTGFSVPLRLRQAADAPSLRDAARTSLPLR